METTIQGKERQIPVRGEGFDLERQTKDGKWVRINLSVMNILEGNVIFFVNGMSDSVKKEITDILRVEFEKFISELRSGETKVFVELRGVDFEQKTLICQKQDRATWNMFYHLYNDLKCGAGFQKFEVGTDVTAWLVSNLDNYKTPQKITITYTCWECGRTYSEKEAYQIAKREGSFDGPTGFYCGC